MKQRGPFQTHVSDRMQMLEGYSFYSEFEFFGEVDSFAYDVTKSILNTIKISIFSLLSQINPESGPLREEKRD